MVKLFEKYSVEDFDELYKYDGKLGAIYSKEKTIFKLWAPLADSVKIIFFGNDGYRYNIAPDKVESMEYKENGIWEIEILGDLNGEFYNYIIKKRRYL